MWDISLLFDEWRIKTLHPCGTNWPPICTSVTFIRMARRNMDARVQSWAGSANEAYVSSQVNSFFRSQNHFPYAICSLTPQQHRVFYTEFSFICRPSSLSFILLSVAGNPGGSNILQRGQGQEKTSAIHGDTDSHPHSHVCSFPGKGY